jgi:hypothetical protein
MALLNAGFTPTPRSARPRNGQRRISPGSSEGVIRSWVADYSEAGETGVQVADGRIIIVGGIDPCVS